MLTYRLSSPSSPNSWLCVAGCFSARSRRTSPTLPPAPATSRSPPVELRRTGGIFRVGTACECSGGLNGRAEGFIVRELAHLVVGDVLRVARADRAVRVPADLQLGRRLLQGVVEHQAPDQRLARADDQLDRLNRLEHAHDTGQRAE